MICRPFYPIPSVALCWFLAYGSAAADPVVVSVADFAGRESFTAGIQEAIDALPAEGGLVVIPPGTYVLRRSVSLRSHVTLRGRGSTTVLTRGKEAVTKLREPAKKADTVIAVESADGFRVGDEFFLRDNLLGGWHSVHDGLVRNVIVRGSVGDGVGVQRGRDIRVIDCLAERCRVHGFHPGTSLRGAVFASNIGRNNGGDGLYFCADVLGIAVTGNLFHDNAWNGIGGLGDQPGGDRFNVVSNNVCRGNGRHGIYANGGGSNLIVGNVCLDNSQAQSGTCSGITLQNASRCVVTGNHCSCDDEKPTQKYGIEEIGQADENTITGNQCHGNVRGGIRIIGQGTQVMANVGKVER